MPTSRSNPVRDAYIANPNHCLHCGNQILPQAHQRLVDVRQKKFCDQSCAASFNNMAARAPKRKPKNRTCTKCGGAFQYKAGISRRWYCPACHEAERNRLENSRKGDVHRTIIASHAFHKLSSLPRVCQACGYDKHVETAHIRGVASFGDDATLSVINALSNLVLLCPNCHWEYDHSLLALP